MIQTKKRTPTPVLNMDYAKMNAEEKRAAEFAEEIVSENNDISTFMCRAALTVFQAWRNCKNSNPSKLKDMTFKTAFDSVKALANDMARREQNRLAAHNQPKASLESAARNSAERHKVHLSVSAAASVATKPATARPTASPATTRSGDWPIRLPRIVSARQTLTTSQPSVNSTILPTPVHQNPTTSKPSATSKATLDSSTLDNFRPNPATVNLRRLHQTRVRQNALRKTRQADDDYEIVGNGELDEEFDLIDGEVPSAVNGSRVTDPDPDAIIDNLNSAFGSSWDSDE